MLQLASAIFCFSFCYNFVIIFFPLFCWLIFYGSLHWQIMWAEAMGKLEGMESTERERLWPQLVHGFKDLSQRLKVFFVNSDSFTSYHCLCFNPLYDTEGSV